MAHSVNGNPCVGNDSTTDCTFNFDEWIEAQKLSVLKPCFIDHEMTTLSSLKMDNANFTKLVADPRTLAHPQLIPPLIAGIQSLKPLQDKSNSITKAKEVVFIEMTSKEKRVFQKCQQYIDEVAQIQSTLKTQIDSAFASTTKQHSDRLLLFKWTNDEKLDTMQSKLDRIFKQLHCALDEKHKALTVQIDQFKAHLNGIRTQYNAMKDALSSKLEESHCIITDDAEYYKESLSKCKGIISADEKANPFDLRKNEQREAAIVRIGEDIQKRHETHHLKMTRYQRELEQFIGVTIGDGKEQMDGYMLTVHNDICRRIEKELDLMISMKMKVDFMQHFHGNHVAVNDTVSGSVGHPVSATQIISEPVDVEAMNGTGSHDDSSSDASTPPLPPPHLALPSHSDPDDAAKSVKSQKSQKSANSQNSRKSAAVSKPVVMDVRLLSNGPVHGIQKHSYSHSHSHSGTMYIHCISLSLSLSLSQ